MRRRLWLTGVFAVAALAIVAVVLWLASDKPVFFSGLLGALIGSGASLAGIALSQRFARERDSEAYRRSLLTARADRLRHHYAALVRAVQALHDASTQLNLLLPGETAEQRDDRVVEELRPVVTDLDANIAALRLEPDTEEVLGAWTRALQDYVGLRHIVETRRTMPQPFSTQDLIDKVTALEQHADSIADVARAHLQRLEKAESAG